MKDERGRLTKANHVLGKKVIKGCRVKEEGWVSYTMVYVAAINKVSFKGERVRMTKGVHIKREKVTKG